MDQIVLQVRGKKEVLGYFDRYDAAVTNRLVSVIETSTQSIYQKAWAAAPVVSGRLVASIWRTRAEAGNIPALKSMQKRGLAAMVAATASHAIYAEMGTGQQGMASYPYPRPEWHRYKATHKWPMTPAGRPLPRLSGWARAVLGRGKSWAVARGIKERGGVRAQPYLYPAYEAEEGNFRDGVRTALAPIPPEPVEKK